MANAATQLVQLYESHQYDDDAVCVHCGFDGAEFYWWKKHTYEGRAATEVKAPLCNRIDNRTRTDNGVA